MCHGSTMVLSWFDHDDEPRLQSHPKPPLLPAARPDNAIIGGPNTQSLWPVLDPH